MTEQPETWPTYTDANGRSWTIEIDTEQIKLLRREIQIDLLAIFQKDDNTLQRLATDTILLVDTLSLLLTDEIKSRGLSATDFGKSLVGDAIDRATDALMEAIGFFSPRHQRTIVNSLWRQQKGLQETQATKLATASPRIAQAISLKIDRAIAEIFNDLDPDGFGS